MFFNSRSLAVFVGGVVLALAVAPRVAYACDQLSSSWANRDDDNDGVCNAVDNCPYEPNADQNAAACAMAAITVPWVPSNPGFPHSTYSGLAITLKGVARYGGNQFMWDFGDGSAPMPWTNFSDAYNLGVKHAYSGDVGRLFIATLSVRSSANPGVVATATYPVQIQNGTDLTDPNQVDVRANVAIDEGLWYLHTHLNRTQYGDGANGWSQRVAYMSGTQSGTCASLDAFALHGSKAPVDQKTDPYIEDAQRLVVYLLANATPVGIGGKAIGNPDYNGNGIGIYLGGNSTYTDGICAAALAAAVSPGFLAPAGNAAWVHRRPMKDVMQDIVEWFAYGQGDAGTWGRGGWWYAANSGGADGSTNQWPILAMSTAEENQGIHIPDFVRQNTPYFIARTHYLGADDNNGGWGYTGYDYLNMAKTSAGMLAHYFVGDSVSHPEVESGLGFLYRHWNDNDGCWNVGMGASYAMYGAMKSMRKPQPNITQIHDFDYIHQVPTGNSFDWYYAPVGSPRVGIASNLLSRQHADGSWSDTTGCHGLSPAHTTAWDTIMLAKGVTTIPPAAAICNCKSTWDLNKPITLDGSCSSDADATRVITKWDWDFAYNGNTFNQTIDGTGFGVTGQTVVKQDGFPSYTQSANGTLNGTTHPVALRVTDNTPASLGGPLSSLATCNVQIKPPPHCPNISLTGAAYSAGTYLASLNVPVTLDASSSFDVDNDPITYKWDLHNNALFADGAGVTLTTTFTQPGTYPIAVQGTDHPELNAVPYAAADCPVAAYATVQVGSHSPVAVPGGPYTSIPNNTIQLDGSASSDPDGLPITYAWDLSGNGLFSDSTLAKPNFVVGNVPAGTAYTVCLKVSNVEKSKTACTTVTVIRQQQPPVCTIVSPVVVASCTGAAQKIAVDGSRSYDLNGNALTYSWSSTCPVPFDNSTAAMPSLTFQTAQQGCSSGCTATLTVNNGFFTSSCNAAISILDNLPPSYSKKPANATFECDGNTTANVNAWLANASASDACAPAGSAVSIGNDFNATAGCGGVGVGNAVKVTWTAQDVCSATSTGQTSATVSVVDTTPPVLTMPADISVVAAGLGGAPVTFSPSALDFVSGSTLVACVPASGSTFPVGITTVSCSTQDSSGNKATGTLSITVLLPVPVLGSATLQAAPVSYAATGQMPIDATGVPGATLIMYENGVALGTVVADASGHFLGSLPLSYGSHTLTFAQQLGSNLSGSTAPLGVTVLPGAPVATSPVQGEAQVGFVPAGATFTVAGHAAANGTVLVYDNGTLLGSSIPVDASGSFSAPFVLSFGPHSLVLVGTEPNAAGGAPVQSAPSGAIQVLSRTAVPTIISPVNGNVFVGSGLSTGTVNVLASGVPGATLNPLDNGSITGQHLVADGAGNYSGPITLAYGPHQLAFTQTIGSTPSDSTPLLTIDVVPPAPVVFTPANGFQTTSTTVVLAAAGVANGILIGLDGAQPLPPIGSDPGGAYSGQYSLDYGRHQLTWSQTINGETSASVSALIDVVPPAPTIVTPATGFDTTADLAVSVSGTAVAGLVAGDAGVVSIFEVRADGTQVLVGTSPVTAGGTYAQSFTFPSGVHTLVVSETLNGETSVQSAPATFSVRPPAPVITTHPASPDNHAAFTGTSFVGATPTTIKVYDGGALVYTTTASAMGAWSFDGLAGTRILQDGLHNLTFTATNNGMESAATPFSFTLWTQPPRLSLTPAPGSVQTTVTQPLGYTNAPGFNPPAGVWVATVVYTFDGKTIYSGPAAGAPLSYDLSLLQPGSHTFTVLATDNLGNADPAPYGSTFTYAPSIATLISLSCGGANQFPEFASLNKGNQNSFCVKLRNSQAAEARGSRTAAGNLLGAYMNEIDGYTHSGKISLATDTVVDADTNWVIAHL